MAKQEQTTQAYPLLPLRGMVVFPYMVTPLEIGRERSANALEQAMLQDKKIVLVTQLDESVEEPTLDDLYPVGTLCQVKQLLKMPEGQLRVLVEGLERVAVDELEDLDDLYQVQTHSLAASREGTALEAEALVRTVLEAFGEYVRLSKKIPSEVLASVSGIKEPERLSDTIAAQISVDVEDKQHLLEILAANERLEELLAILVREKEILGLERRIHQRVRKQMERSQKEYYLREQIKAIQKELGEKDDRSVEVDEFRARLKKAKLPKEAKEKVEHELDRLEKMPPMAAEAVVVRNYLDWMLSLPWSKTTKDRLDIGKAEEILEDDHYGLTKVKERILEFLAVRQLTNDMKGPILCLVGPPGVGKTSLARSVASALQRKFVRLSLGGVRDEAEIRGHRRTYVGALPGKIIQALKTAGSKNPVILLDEVDKLAADFRGDPTSALLEVLDPEQNNTFSDHYLEVPFDLSQVLFLTTGNVLSQIPPPLRDRMEVIQIPGYTAEEKLEIAKRHLWSKQLQAHGLSEDQVKLSENTIMKIIEEYTREAGVRTLERQLASLCRKTAAEVVKGASLPIRITVNSLSKYLGMPRFRRSEAEREDRVGVATGLAYTQYGGEILSIEVTAVPGKGKLTLTGQLGEVMRESAHAAMSYIRSRHSTLGVAENFHETTDIHVHIPEGAVPKDGPSAGITMATALTSALSGKAVRSDLAMTGEITLRGRVLPIGGVKEKLLAAHRAGIDHILLPAENQKDLEELPANIRRKLRLQLVRHMDEVLAEALRSQDTMEPPLPVDLSTQEPAGDAQWLGGQA